MPVHLTNRQRRFPVNPEHLAATAGTCLDALGIGHAELSVLLVNDRAMRPMNQEYRGMDKSTDVLSFPLLEGAPEDVLATLRNSVGNPMADLELGDVVISVETALAQAAERDLPLKDELSLLLAHGILHLLGYDHETGDADAAKMAAAERALLAHLGLSHPSLISRAHGP